MNPIHKLLVAAAGMAAGFLIQGSVLAHSGETHVEAMEYDATETEFGSYEPGMKPDRTIEMSMSDDMKFTPGTINVKKGEVLKIVHENKGKLMHEFVLGTPELLEEHAEMMKKFPGMEHDEPYMLHVPPGKSGAMIWRFDQAGEVSFGCLIPGHFDAGMKGSVLVEG